MAVVDAAVDHGNTNASAGESGVPRGGRTDYIVGSVVHETQRVVDGHRDDVRISLEGGKRTHGNGEGGALDHVQPRMQTRTTALHGRVMRRGRRLLVLHDDPHRL